ncbi:MAG TPA: hypothetical protein VN673_04060 [Clostridia bacterium]|nr:hypothetical protein [Clostridia bacterium]
MNDLISAFIGAVIGSVASYILSLRSDKKQKQKQINAVLRAIRYELEILSGYYDRTSGGLLAKVKEGEPHLTYFVLGEEYFIVYPNNTEIVGQIDDAELCKAIVGTYNKANFLREGFRINNLILDQGKNAEGDGRENLPSVIFEKLVQSASILKTIDADLKQETKNLYAKMDSYLRNHPTN